VALVFLTELPDDRVAKIAISPKIQPFHCVFLGRSATLEPVGEASNPKNDFSYRLFGRS